MAKFFSRFPRARAGGDGDGVVIEATEVRQGRWGRHVFWVLVFSTILAVLALFGSWAFRADDLADASAKSTPTAAETQAAGQPVGG